MTRAAPRAVLLFNPRAGQRRGRRAFPAIVHELGRTWCLRPLPTASPVHCRELAADAARDGVDAVFVLGGDGTLRVAATVLAGSATALGVLPGGTTNVVAGALGLPDDPLAAARALARPERRELDVGRFGDERFLMQVSGGLDSRVMARVDPRWKKRLGKLAVVVAGLRAWFSYDFPVFELEVDGRPVAAAGFVVANLARYAGSFEIVPGASAEDRQLELLLFHGRRRRAALGFALDLARGRHLERHDVEVRPVGRVRLLGPARAELQADGDPFVATPPLDLELAAERLTVLVPPATSA
jgi:YegS/Rv2252/BmrU family lipid kinase